MQINNSMINTVMARLNPKTQDRSRKDLFHCSFVWPSRECARDCTRLHDELENEMVRVNEDME